MVIDLYIDSNIFIYSFIDNTEQGDMARKLMERIVRGETDACASPLVLDEVLWVVQRLRGKDVALRVGNALMNIPLTWLDISYDSARYSLDFYEKGMKPRDALHLGVMKDYGIREILTEDMEFKRIEDFKVLRLKDVNNP